MRRAAVAGMWCIFAVGTAWACSVPVFRWALERWEPDPYELVVFHQGALSEADQAAVAALEARVRDRKYPANLAVRSVDLNEELDEHTSALWESQHSPALPWAALFYPPRMASITALWAGPPSGLAPDALLDSPLRQAIAKDLLGGKSGVWVLLEIGERAKDDAAAERLGALLKQMNETLHLPDMADDPVLAGPNAPNVANLRVDFSMSRLSRNDPAETLLAAMLLNSESDLHTFQEPIAFPIYGRGRALYAFVGKGINEDTIGTACGFLVGRCSCEIKGENPGTDLLMAVDWEGGLGGKALIEEIELPPLPGVAAVAVASKPETTGADSPEVRPLGTCPVTDMLAAAGPEESEGPAAVGGRSVLLTALWPVGGVLCLAIAATLWLRRKKAD